MKQIITVIILLLLWVFTSCVSSLNYCDVDKLYNLKLWPVNCTLKLPQYKLKDSARYDPNTILNYDVQSVDSTIHMVIFVKSFKNIPQVNLDIVPQLVFQKQEVEFNRKSPKLLIDTFQVISSVKIGFVKYLVEEPTKIFYESRIIFYRGDRLVTIWLFENYSNQNEKNHTFAECVLKTINFY